MSTAHHGQVPSDDGKTAMDEIMRRFVDQVEGRAKRKFSDGRIGPNDDGDVSFACSADAKNKIVILDFGKPVSWIGMQPEQAVAIAEMLVKFARQVSDRPLTIEIK